MRKEMNHIEYPKSLKGKSVDALRHIREDAYRAAQAMPDGENVGYYLDEVNYCADELARRRKS